VRFGSPPAPRTPQAPWHGAGSGPPDSGGPSLGQGPSRPPRKPPRAHIALATQPWRPDPRGRSRQLGPPGLSWRGGRQLSELARAISKFAEGGGNPEIAGFTIAPGGGTRWGRGFLRRGAPRLLLSPPPASSGCCGPRPPTTPQRQQRPGPQLGPQSPPPGPGGGGPFPRARPPFAPSLCEIPGFSPPIGQQIRRWAALKTLIPPPAPRRRPGA